VPARGNKTARSADEWLIDVSDGDESGDLKPKNDPAPMDAEQEPDPIEVETAQWVVQPAIELNGRKGGSSAEARPVEPTIAARPTRPAPEESEPVVEQAKPEPEAEEPTKAESTRSDRWLKELRAENRELAKRIRELQTELRVQVRQATKDGAKALKEREAELKQQIKSIGQAFEEERAGLASRLEQREAELEDRIDELESALEEAKKNTTAKPTAPKRGRARKPSKKEAQLDLNAASFEELRNLGLSVTQSARLIAYRDVRGGYESLDELADIPGLSAETRSGLREQLTLST
jgi:DNA uptake protein ComE-like DNA-binding protein